MNHLMLVDGGVEYEVCQDREFWLAIESVSTESLLAHLPKQVASVILLLCEVPGPIQYLNQPETSDLSSAANMQI
jgi:hypothetical protein